MNIRSCRQSAVLLLLGGWLRVHAQTTDNTQTTNTVPETSANPQPQTNAYPAYPQGLATNYATPYVYTPSPFFPAAQANAVQASMLTTVPGSGLLGSPVMGTSAFGAPANVEALTSSGPGGGGGGGSRGMLRWGPLDFHPFVSDSITYESGLGSTPGERSSSTLDTVSAGVTVNIRDHWIFNYAASFENYFGGGYSDSTSQFVALLGNFGTEAWPINLAESYSHSSSPLVETGAQTSQDGYSTSLSTGHMIGDSLSMNLGVSQAIRDASGFGDIDIWSGSAGLNYIIVPRVSAGLSFSGGYQEVSGGINMAFEDLEGVIAFHPGSRFALNLSAGIEEQQFLGTSAGGQLSPIFSAGLSYRLFRDTLLSLSAARVIAPSFYSSQDTTATMFTGSLLQPVTRKISLSLTGGYSDSSYAALVVGPLPAFWIGSAPSTVLSVDRRDTFTFTSASLRYAILNRLNLSIYYTREQNSSSQNSFAFTSSQFGAQLSYRY